MITIIQSFTIILSITVILSITITINVNRRSRFLSGMASSSASSAAASSAAPLPRARGTKMRTNQRVRPEAEPLLSVQEEEAQVPYGEMWQGHMDTIWELMTREELVDEIKWRREDQLYLEKRIESQKEELKKKDEELKKKDDAMKRQRAYIEYMQLLIERMHTNERPQ